jgi:hypothetical protein
LGTENEARIGNGSNATDKTGFENTLSRCNSVELRISGAVLKAKCFQLIKEFDNIEGLKLSVI